LTHAPLPLVLFIVPCAHALQPLVTPPVYPALQTQSSWESLPCGEMLFWGHDVHDPGELPVHPVRYSPAPHCELHAVHVPCAVPPQPETYCPDGHTGHAEHEPRSGAVASRARGQESGNGLHAHGAAHTIAHAAGGRRACCRPSTD